MAVRARVSGSRFVSLMALVTLTSLAVAGFVFARRASHDESRRLLHESGGQVAAILASATNNVESSLRLLGDVYAAAGEATPGFGDAAKSLLTGGATSIGVAEIVGDAVIVRAREGAGSAPGERLTGARANLFRRAADLATLISTRIDSTIDDGVVLVFASGRSDRLVVFEETMIRPDQPLPSTPESPFNNLDIALYRSTTTDSANLILTTTARVPIVGSTDQRAVTVGSEQWQLVIAARSPLTSAQSRAVPWIILLGGLLIAAASAGVLGLVTRRRRYALELVDARTADLHHAMVDLEAARAVADDANRAKSEFLSRMSHELRTPLNAVLGFAQLLEVSDHLDASDQDSVTHILKGGGHLLTLIEEVLDISKIESGDIALSPESVLACDVVAETVELMRPLAAARSIRLSASPEATCVQYVFADHQRLKQILLNLVSNAIKYNRMGGSVALTCEHTSPTRLRLKVTDTGPGILDADIARLFVPFERLGAGLTDVEGSGIGLALSRRLVEAIGGSIGVESEPGHGSTFWIELPLVEGAIDRYERLQEVETLHGYVTTSAPFRRSLLYIEDNLANLTLVERIIADRTDLEIIPAMQGGLGVDLARQHQPALILLDLHLPDTNGEIVLQQLRDDPTTRCIPVIIVSADATLGQIQRLTSAGASAYLTKPINVREFLRLLDEFLPTMTTATAQSAGT